MKTAVRPAAAGSTTNESVANTKEPVTGASPTTVAAGARAEALSHPSDALSPGLTSWYSGADRDTNVTEVGSKPKLKPQEERSSPLVEAIRDTVTTSPGYDMYCGIAAVTEIGFGIPAAGERLTSTLARGALDTATPFTSSVRLRSADVSDAPAKKEEGRTAEHVPKGAAALKPEQAPATPPAVKAITAPVELHCVRPTASATAYCTETVGSPM